MGASAGGGGFAGAARAARAWFAIVPALLMPGCAREGSRRSPDVVEAVSGDDAGDAGRADVDDAGSETADGSVEWTVPPPPPPPPVTRADGDGFRSFRAGPLRAGRSARIAPAAPMERWRFDVGGPIRVQPALDPGGAVYVASLDGKVCRVLPGGVEDWCWAADDRIYSVPWIGDDGLAVFGADTDLLYGLGGDGRVRWTMLPPDGTERPEWHDVDTSPIVSGRVGYVGAGIYLYAFDLQGAVRWRAATGGKVFSSPAVLPDGTVVVGSQDDRLWAFRPGGAVRWTYATDADVDGTPAVDEVRETIYVGADDGRVHAVSFDGRPVWSAKVGGFVRSGIAIDRVGRVYAATFGPTARLAALDPETGEIRWSQALASGPTAEFGVRSSPITDAAGTVIVGVPGGSVRAFSPEGRPVWTVRVPDDVDSGPILASDGTLYFGCDDGFLRAVGEGGGGDPGGEDEDVGGATGEVDRNGGGN
jgi:outer membrane protein assembly factor BamB